MGRRAPGRRTILAGVIAVVASLTTAPLVATPDAGALTPPSGGVSTARITAAQLLRGVKPSMLTANSRFAPDGKAESAPPFTGTLKLAGARMGVFSDAADHKISNPVGGKDTRFFPDVAMSFFTVGQQLVPTTENVIRNGVLPRTRSYWDFLVQPGRVWTEPGDHGWHRASFPFALVNSIEGETHTGIALLLYRGHRVSHVRFQVVQQTSPYDVPEYFSAWGVSAATFRPGVAHLSALRRRHRAGMAARLPERRWSALRGVANAATLSDFAHYSDTVEAAAVVGGKLYRTSCPTSAGPLPYCSGVRYGVWSMTKSAMLNVALLRLAQKYGRSVLHQRIARYLPRARGASWRDVTIGDLANMASGHGPKQHPRCYLCDYSRWYLAPSEHEKTVQALDYTRYTEPGTQYNYRDQDAYLLGVVEEKLLRSRQGPHASLWRMLRNQVYRPLGIEQAPTNLTVEKGARRGHPMMAYGYYPTLNDLARISALYQHHGAWRGRQILDRSLVQRLLAKPAPAPQALPATKNGLHYYLMDWHIMKDHVAPGCTRYVPQMLGWGGNTVTVLPHRTTLLRIRNNWVGDPSYAQKSINALADVLSPGCS